MNRKQFAALGILSIPTISLAQQTLPADTTKVVDLEEVVVNALKVSNQSPFAFSDVKKEEILIKNDGRDLPYLLDQTPSVLVNSDAGNGVGYTDIRVRGTDGNRINLTVNGIPINDAESQGVFFVNFPDIASSTSNIQIQRGVGASTNGSGAFGASIHINNMEQSEKASATLVNSVGSFNTWRHSLTAGTGRLNNGFNIDLRLSKITSDGYIDRSGSDLKSFQFLSGWTSKDNRTNLKFNLLSGREKTGQAWNGVSEADLKANRRFNELGIKEDGTFYENQTDNYQQDYYQLFFNHKLNSNWRLNAGLFLTRGKGYYDEYRIGEDYADYGLPYPVVGMDTIEETSLTRQLHLDNYYYGGIFNISWFKNRTKAILGGAITQYDGKHFGNITWSKEGGIENNYKWYDLDAFKFDANVYAKLEQQLSEQLYFTTDLQLRSVDYKINGFRKNPNVNQHNKYLFFNPKIGLSYLSQREKAYFSVAVANKEPNRNDFEAGVDKAPKPEQLLDFELGYAYLTSQTELSANLYYMHYNNQLILSGKINDVGAYTRENVKNSFRRGIELSAKHKFNDWLHVNANTTLSQNKINSFVEYIDDYDEGGQLEVAHKNKDIAFSPSIIAQLGVRLAPFKLRNNQTFSVGINGKYVGKQYLDNTSSDSRSIAGYELVNATLRYTAAIKGFTEITVLGSVNNLLNKKYSSKGYTYSYLYEGMQTFNYFFPQAGTNYNLTLILSIK
jgi:iron complex outermembrane receptor protein